MGDQWEKYYARWEGMKERMKGVLETAQKEVGGEIWEDNSNDYGYVLDVPHGDGVIAVSIKLVDSAESENTDPGTTGNFQVEIIGPGGVVIGNYVPNNYTPDCWIAYEDEALWEERLDEIERIIAHQIGYSVEHWKSEQDPTFPFKP